MKMRFPSPSTAIILCSLPLLLLAACSTTLPEGSSIDYGLTLAPSGIDPHLHASAELGIPLSSVYDTLIFRDPDTGEYVPGLAENWSISPDGMTYSFSLRKDVLFHDGTPFNAQAVQANIEYTLNPDHHSFKAAIMLGPLDEVQVSDEYNIAFHLSEPYAPLLDSLSQVYLGMASPAALDAWGPAEYQFHQVGTGPYRFVEYIPNDHLTLVRNTDYRWAPSIYMQTQAEIESITFRFYEDLATRALALESRNVDIMGEVPPHDAARLAASDDFDLYPIPIPGQPLQFFFNTLLAPTDDVRVRQALILAVDRPKVVETIFGEYSPVAVGLLASSTDGFSSTPTFPAYDPAKSIQLLEDAGWIVENSDGIRSRNGMPLELLIVSPPWGSNSEVAQLLSASWESVGAEVTIEIAPGFGPLKEAQAGGEYHVIGINLFDTDPDLLRSFYSSTGLYNWSGIDNPELDEILSNASQTTSDPALRQALYQRAAELIHQEALVLPVRDYVNLVIASNSIQDLRFSAQGWFPFLIDLHQAH